MELSSTVQEDPEEKNAVFKSKGPEKQTVE